MTNLIHTMIRLDYISCVLTVLGAILLGKKLWQGWVVCAINSAVVCVIGVRTAQFGFIPANLFCIALYHRQSSHLALQVREKLSHSQFQLSPSTLASSRPCALSSALETRRNNSEVPIGGQPHPENGQVPAANNRADQR